MSRMNRNFVFAYAFLVILPLVGLAGILKSGRSLTAPVSIDGQWILQADPAQLDSLPCGKLFDQAIMISQSGERFVLSFPNGPKITALGILDDTTLRATFTQPESSSKTNCTPESQVSMLATVARRADGGFLSGRLFVPSCATCPSVAFRAHRQAPARLSGGQ